MLPVFGACDNDAAAWDTPVDAAPAPRPRPRDIDWPRPVPRHLDALDLEPLGWNGAPRAVDAPRPCPGVLVAAACAFPRGALNGLNGVAILSAISGREQIDRL